MEIAILLLMATEQFYLVFFWLTASLPGFSSHPAKGTFFPVGISVIWAFHSSSGGQVTFEQ
jgi:hypothetical protein